MIKASLAGALLIALAFQPAAAAVSPIEALQPWSRPAAAGGTGVGYVTLVNHSRKPDALVAVETPVAERVEMHAASMAGGVMRMSPEARVPLPPGGEVSFAPGGRHLMLVGLKRALHAGDKLPATLRFASGAQLKLEFTVGAGAAPAAAHDHRMPGM